VTPASASRLDVRLGLLAAGIALLLNFHFFTAGWDNNLLGAHQFRQLQTAISADYIADHGVSLGYGTPLLGPPWSIPLEFPLFQSAAAAVGKVTGLHLDAAGRLTSWLFFVAGLPATFMLLRAASLSVAQRLLAIALVLASPLYLYISQLFLIEAAATSLSQWFLLGCWRALETRRPGWFALAWVAGSLAATVKVTTWIVHLVPLAIYIGWRCWPPRGNARTLIRDAAVTLAATLPSALLALAWVVYSKNVRDLNPDATFLNSHFGVWTFGDLPLRFSWAFWSTTFRTWADLIVGEAGILLCVFILVAKTRFRLAAALCAGSFLAAQLIFSNLYWIHDYYFYASGLFLVVVVGLALAELLERAPQKIWVRGLIVAAVVGLSFSAFARTYLNAIRHQTPVPQVAELLRVVVPENEMIVCFGLDWDGAVPYYADRKALMLSNGRDLDLPGMKQSIERLNSEQVGAVVLAGHHWRNNRIVTETMASLDLGEYPLFYDGANFSVWVPRARHDRIRTVFSPASFSQFRVAPARTVAGGTRLGPWEIRRRSEFKDFSPMPVSARADTDLAPGQVDFRPVVIAHATSELVFEVEPGSRKLTGVFGLDEHAYTNGNQSDGVTLAVSDRTARGERLLFQRHLDPRNNSEDRGPQEISIELPTDTSSRITVRLLPGPANNGSFDWSYIGQIQIR
jgi:hypothetical protein